MLLIGKLKLNNSEEFIKENLQPSYNNIYETIKAVREYKSTAPHQSSLDWLIGLDQEISKVSKNVYDTIYPIILKG